MSLRIIAGSLKGRVIPSPISDVTRPTTDMWRSSLFSALEDRTDLDNTKVLDLYAGTGALGLECISRGAAHVTFVENHRQTARQLRTSINDLGVADKCTVVDDDVARLLATTTDRYDIILADPPYAMRIANKLRDVISLRTLLNAGGLLLIEHGDAEYLLDDDRWIIEWHKERSGTMVTLLRWNPPQP